MRDPENNVALLAAEWHAASRHNIPDPATPDADSSRPYTGPLGAEYDDPWLVTP